MSAVKAPVIEEQPADKTIATLRARLALAGNFELMVLPDGALVVQRWDWSQHCADLAELEQFVERLESMR